MLTKINIGKIITDHFATLKDADSKKISRGDFFLFILLPLLFSSVIVMVFCIFLTESLVNILITCLSIFVGLLLNLLVIIFDIINKLKTENSKDQLKKLFLKEIYANISFCILISIVNIGFLVVTFSGIYFVKLSANVLSVAILMLFGLTLLMILKRVHILLSNEFKNEG